MQGLPACVMSGVQPERKGARHDTWLALGCAISTSSDDDMSVYWVLSCFSSIYGTHLCETSFFGCSCKTSDDVSGNRPVDEKHDEPDMPEDETSEDVPGNRPVDNEHVVPGMPEDETSEDVPGNRPVDEKHDIPGMPEDKTSDDVPGNRPVDEKHDLPGMPVDLSSSDTFESLSMLSSSHDAGCIWYILPQRLTDGADAT